MVEPEQPAHFLLLHSETGGGHRRAALSVADALRFRYGERARVAVVDALADYAPWPFRRLPEWYGDMLWGGGWSYGLGYQLLNGRRRARGAARLSWPRVRTAARHLLMDCPADVVVSFHPLLVQPLCRALAATVSPAPLVAVGADLVAMHAFWVDPRVRRYLVATDAARAELLRHGADPARVEVMGLPVRRRFAEAARADAPSARARVGLDPRRPAVLDLDRWRGWCGRSPRPTRRRRWW
jgi:1,2-diacylglycerol 3-beta-galactosyltransferase